MTFEDLPQDHPQRALTQLLVGCLNQAGQPHEVMLGSLITIYADLALKNPCCLSESARAIGELLALFNRTARSLSGGAKPQAEAIPLDAQLAAATPASAEAALATALLQWLTARVEPTHVHMNVLISLYRHLALALPAQTEAAALASSALAGELLSRTARIAQAAHDAAAATTH